MSAQTSVVPHLPAASRLALRDQLAERLESAVAPSTRAAYRRGWGQFSAWASAHGFAVRPATPESVGAYADQLARSGRKPSSIRFALAANARAWRLLRVPTVPKKSPNWNRRR